MVKRTARILFLTTLAFLPSNLASQTSFRQTQADDYTRYELQDPESQSFRIFYDVSATTAGAPYFFNSLRAGSTHIVHGVTDLQTGIQLEWKVITGEEARAVGHERANPAGEYLQVVLTHPVPDGGEGRVRIDKTYRDTASYYREGDEIVFSRSWVSSATQSSYPQATN